METIKDRAKKAANLCYECIKNGHASQCLECESRGEYNGYVRGATIQLIIDVDQAVLIHCSMCDKHLMCNMNCWQVEQFKQKMMEC